MCAPLPAPPRLVSRAAAAAAAAAAMLRACSAEEWSLSNAINVDRRWEIAEVEFYADLACKERIDVVRESAWVSHLPRDFLWSADVEHVGEDCWMECNPGLCDWCGQGNACCRRGFAGDPAVCHHGIGHTSDHHECVAIGLKGPITQKAALHAFDRNHSTEFSAECAAAPGGCPPRSLQLGVGLPTNHRAVRCVAVWIPVGLGGLNVNDPRALAAVSEQFALARDHRATDPRPCPGICRSGRYLQGRSGDPCTEHLSQHGFCGNERSHRAGADCRGCKGHFWSWEAAPLPAVDLSLRSASGQQYTVLSMREKSPRARAAKVTRAAEQTKKVARMSTTPSSHPQVGQRCWDNCMGKAGFCKWCGAGAACCRKGAREDPPECRMVARFVSSQYECVKVESALVKRGVPGTPPPSAFGKKQQQPLAEGEDCLSKCGGRSGFCKLCGADRACCKKGAAADPEECRRAVGFVSGHHECVRLSSPRGTRLKLPEL